jgi:hypothetical protein
MNQKRHPPKPGVEKMSIFQGGYPLFNTNCGKHVGRTVNNTQSQGGNGDRSILHKI